MQSAHNQPRFRPYSNMTIPWNAWTSTRTSYSREHDNIIKPLKDLVEPGWAAALADVEPQVHHMGDFLSSEIAGRTSVPSRQPEHSARLHHSIRLHQGAYRRAGSLPDSGASGRTELLRGARRPADSAESGQHLQRARRRHGRADARQRRPDTLDQARRDAAQQMPDRRSGDAPTAIRARDGRPSPTPPSAPLTPGSTRTASQAAGGDPVGAQRAEPRATAHQRDHHRLAASQPYVRIPRVLRLQPVLPRQPSAGLHGRRTGRLVTAIGAGGSARSPLRGCFVTVR